MSSLTNNPVEISSFYSHLSMMPSLINAAPKLPPNLYRPNSWMDPTMQPFFYYNLALNDPNHKRKNATRETTATLKAWLYEHRKNPYPTKNEKMVLAMVTKMTLTQVSTWFANARRRLKKENKLHRTTNNSKSEEEEDDDDVDDEDDEDNENDTDSHVASEQEATVKAATATPLKRKRDETDDDDGRPTSLQPPPTSRPKIWSLVDVVQSNESKRSSSSSAPTPASSHIIHPYITPSIPYLLYPPPSTSSPSHSSCDQSSNSLSSPQSSSASCSPTK